MLTALLAPRFGRRFLAVGLMIALSAACSDSKPAATPAAAQPDSSAAADSGFEVDTGFAADTPPSSDANATDNGQTVADTAAVDDIAIVPDEFIADVPAIIDLPAEAAAIETTPAETAVDDTTSAETAVGDMTIAETVVSDVGPAETVATDAGSEDLCQKNAVVCKDTPCAKAACVPATGKCEFQPAADGKVCDDGDDCTVNTSCKAGICEYDTFICQCKVDKDCAKFEDANLCNGGIKCNSNHKCVADLSTVVVCPKAAKVCDVASCNPVTGACVVTAAVDDASCEDGDPCTFFEGCQAGVCEGGVMLCQCAADADCAKSEDGDLCNGTLYCDKSAPPYLCNVKPGSAVVCPSTGACTPSICDPTSGQCAPKTLANGSACTVGVGCVQTGNCVNGAWAATSAKSCQCANDMDCNDGLNCTADTCETGLCVHVATAEGKECADSTGCNSGGICKGGLCTASKQQLWSSLQGDYGTEVGYAVAALDTDLAFLVTKAKLGASPKAFVQRVTPVGETAWSLDVGAGSTEGRPALALVANGLIVNTGESVVRVSADGKVVWSVKPTGGFPRLVGIGVTTGGGVAVAANQTATKEWDISLLTFGADGQKLLDVPVVQPLTADLAHAIAVATDGQFVIAGVANAKTGSNQTVVRFDAKGSLLSSGPIVGSTAKTWTGAFALKGGDVLLGGDQRVTRIDAAGKVVWERVTSSINVYGFAELSDGGWMVVGTSGAKLGVARLAPNGVKWWLKSWGGPMGDQGWGLALLPSGAMGLAGGNRTEGKGYSDAWLFRTDAFANPSCTESGICASKTATGCDDSEFCNVNTCTGDTGCKTNKLYGSPVCGDGLTCTDAGICK